MTIHRPTYDAELVAARNDLVYAQEEIEKAIKVLNKRITQTKTIEKLKNSGEPE